MKKYVLFLMAVLVGLVGLSAILLACGVETDFTSWHGGWALVTWIAFALVCGTVCRHQADKWGVNRVTGITMNLVFLFAALVGVSVTIQLGKVIFVALAAILLALICLISYLIRRWMAWLKAV
jgi:hypothetical protein